MARYQVILAYDGTDFHGYQRQAKGRTVQAVVEQALHRMGWQGDHIRSAGRTDTGVHAVGQVIAFDLDWHHPVQDIQNALNAYLPMDVVSRQVRQVSMFFDPRRDAISRRYRYRIFIDSIRSPLRERYAWRVWPALDLAVLRQMARFLCGKHDFAAFGTPPQAGGSTVRTVYQADWLLDGSDLFFEVVADAYLYHMVRRMVILQSSIASGKLAEDDMHLYMLSPDAKPLEKVVSVRGLAPPQGLCLEEVCYPQDKLASE